MGKVDAKEVIYKVAEKNGDMGEVFKIRYEAYVNEKYIRPNEAGIFSDKFDSLPTSITFLAMHNGKPFGTMRLVIDSDEYGLPMDKEGFSQDIEHLRNDGRKLAEVCKFAFLKNGDSVPKKIFLDIQKIMFINATANNVNDLVITIVPQHVPFYEKLLLFERLKEGIYHSLNSIKAVSMRINLDNLEERYREKYQNKRLDLHKHFFGEVSKNILL